MPAGGGGQPKPKPKPKSTVLTGMPIMTGNTANAGANEGARGTTTPGAPAPMPRPKPVRRNGNPAPSVYNGNGSGGSIAPWFDNGTTPNSGGTPTGMYPGGGGMGARPSLPSSTSSAGAASALLGGGGPMYGTTAPAVTPAATPVYNPPTSISSAPSFSGMASESAQLVDDTFQNVPASAPDFPVKTSPQGAIYTQSSPTAAPMGAYSVPAPAAPGSIPSLAEVQRVIVQNTGKPIAPGITDAGFKSLAAAYGYTSWA